MQTFAGLVRVDKVFMGFLLLSVKLFLAVVPLRFAQLHGQLKGVNGESVRFETDLRFFVFDDLFTHEKNLPAE